MQRPKIEAKPQTLRSREWRKYAPRLNFGASTSAPAKLLVVVLKISGFIKHLLTVVLNSSHAEFDLGVRQELPCAASLFWEWYENNVTDDRDDAGENAFHLSNC